LNYFKEENVSNVPNLSNDLVRDYIVMGEFYFDKLAGYVQNWINEGYEEQQIVDAAQIDI
jgi:hypothetical protein